MLGITFNVDVWHNSLFLVNDANLANCMDNRKLTNKKLPKKLRDAAR
jgi:hypothetical protein